MAAPSSASFSHPAKSSRPGPRHTPSSAPSTISSIISLPPQWLHQYEDYVAKNAGQVSQIESALRSLTYIIPGRFRDAEIASETLHSSVQLLSLYHDSLLSRAISRLSGSGAAAGPPPSPHGRYTRFWADRSPLYRRVALLLQTVRYTELLCEMAAKRRGGDRAQWRVVLLLEFIKACCRLLLLRITRSRPVVTPALPEREPVPETAADDEAEANEPKPWEESEEEQDMEKANGSANGAATTSRSLPPPPPPHEKEWTMPRTGMSLPSLPNPSDITSYLLGRVLTADDIKPAAKLLNRLRGGAHAAEVLHILAPLVYALAMAQSKSRRSWTPWVLGVAVECAARQLRDRGLRATALERDEWRRRGWAMGWWAMRGAFYESVTKGVVAGVRKKMPSLVSGILEDYEYLWENYYFSTSSA